MAREFSSINVKATAKERDAFNLGAQSKRAGTYIGKGREWYRANEQNLITWFDRGYKAQIGQPGKNVTFAGYHFLLNDAGEIVIDGESAPKDKEATMKTRTAEELAALRAEYQPTYDAYAADQTSQGFEPQSFDEAFSAHLSALDAETPATGDGATTADAGATAPAATEAKPETKKAQKAREVAERKAAREAEKAKKAAEKPAAAPKAKKFRPTSDDRKTVMAAAGKLVGEETPRLKQSDGKTYDDFLKGVDTTDGGATILFDVFTAKGLRAEKPERVGQLKVVIEGGTLKSAVKA